LLSETILSIWSVATCYFHPAGGRRSLAGYSVHLPVLDNGLANSRIVLRPRPIRATSHHFGTRDLQQDFKRRWLIAGSAEQATCLHLHVVV